MKRHLLLTFISLLSACSNLPPAIEDPPLYDISYSQATRNIGQFKEAPVRWGGVVIDVENEQNFSLVQVLYYPLGSWGRPKTDDPNEGRFLIKSSDFLDPAVYKKDTEITVAGTLKGDIERKVGNKTLRMPLISSTVIHLWPAYVYVPGYYYGGYGGYGYGGFGYGYPYYGYYGYYPYYPYYPYYSYYPYYPYYNYNPYYSGQSVDNQQEPETYIERGSQDQEQIYWYFCKDPEGYYPYVKNCPKGWLKVMPDTTPQGEGE